ncbi:hypothetical protein [Streptomyces sp. NPDC006415]|uniref:hypothetical protein n=1 Tax=Streptomyces sp. NPDC006415 TaxID=3155351 RepID=UPI00339FD0B6
MPTAWTPTSAPLGASPPYAEPDLRSAWSSKVATGSGRGPSSRLPCAFGRPPRPALPGLAEFTGQVLHAADCRSPAPFAGGRLVVVGASSSAAQIAAELAVTARVTLATRGPVQFAAQ